MELVRRGRGRVDLGGYGKPLLRMTEEIFMFRRKRKDSITVKFGGPRSVVVNEQVFVCKMADIDIMEQILALQGELSGIKEGQTEEILAATRKMIGLIDLMLGEGATGKIFGSNPVSLHDAVGVTGEIAAQVIAVYNDAACAAYGV